jgi:NAD(P)-dependent dehydrogenase (short-subunit alcohol dehydrogenase family)
MDRFSLSGKVVVITGGSGLYGRQLTAAIAEAGATVIIASRNLEKLNAEALSHRNRGLDVAAELLDLADEQSIIALRDRLIQRHGHIDGLVNNSVLRPMQKLDDPVQAWEDSLKVNATGLFLISRAFGEAMGPKQCGSMVNIGSIQGMVGPSAELYQYTDMGMPPPDYFFHKGGMINLTRYFAAVLGPKNVRVNCVSAGGFYNNQPEPFLSQYKDRTMLGRMAGNDDLAGVVVFLLGDASSYVTGANIAVDGGYTAK